MITCIAIDDEPHALELIRKYCSMTGFTDLKKTFTKPSEAAIYLSGFPVDLLFLDIQMPDISGIDFYKSLNVDKPVIFTTAYSEYAVEGFDLNAVDYLLKPVSFKRFEKAVIRAREYIEYINNRKQEPDEFLYVRSDYKLVKILYADIQYIEGMDNYVKIYTGENKPVISLISLKEICEKLPEKMFARIHRSYIINTTTTISYSNKRIHIGNLQIPVGISYMDTVKKLFGKY